MKTSLNLEDELFESAKREAAETGKSLSEVISFWARKGRDTSKKNSRHTRRKYKTVNLGRPLIDLTRRKDWMEILDNDRD